MTVPWVDGTVPAVAAELRTSRSRGSDADGMATAAAIGMITGLVEYDARPPAARLADVRTVIQALHLVQEEPA